VVYEDAPETRIALSTSDRLPPFRRSWKLVAAAFASAGIVVIALGMALTAASRTTEHKTPEQAVVATAPAPAADEGASSKSTAQAPTPTVVEVRVTPGAKVEVDGADAALSSKGQVQVSGALGSTHRVHASLAGRDVTIVVAITENGAIPSKIDVPPPERRPPILPPPSKPAKKSEPVAPPSSPPPPKGLVTSFE
jgi:serine/threonine-protein kinase